MSNPFDTLGVPRAFTIDPRRLQERFIALSAANHPDKFADPLDQADAAERAAEINEAFRTLADPMLRAHLLLQMLTQGAGDKHDVTALPPGFLMEVMEIREGIEEARDEGDQGRLDQVKAEAEKEFQGRMAVLGALLDKACQTPTETGISQARLELNALRYIKRMIQGI